VSNYDAVNAAYSSLLSDTDALDDAAGWQLSAALGVNFTVNINPTGAQLGANA
jgi:hypothetical protein